MALNTQQLLYLNVLMNGGALCTDAPANAGEFARRLLESASTDKERTILENILADERLRGMTVLNPACEAWGAGYCAFVDGNDEIVVAFRGTTTGAEWYDNFAAANEADSTHQRAALAYLEGIDLSGYASVTVTGHSKGGNKAMYCATLSDRVDRCASFDGQGFSDAFMEKYARQIGDRRDRIENHCAGGDYINVLLNGIGKTHYYETHNPSDNFFLNHELTAMCDDAGNLHPGAQEPTAREFGAFANSYLRALPARWRESTLDLLGRMAALILKGDTKTAGAGDLWSLIHQRQYRRELSFLLGYIIRYERDTGIPVRTLRGLLANLNAGAPLREIGEKLLDLLEWQADNPLALIGIASGVNVLISDANWSYILELISDAAWLSERIERSA